MRQERPPISRLTDRVADTLGHELAFPTAVSAVAVWLAVGWWLGLHQTLVATVATMATFVMVFALEHTSSREARALNLKLDELIRATAARNELIGAEDESHGSLDARRQELLRARDGEHAVSPGGDRGITVQTAKTRRRTMGEKLKGKLDQATGAAKQAAGRASGDEELEQEGTGERVKGDLREAAGKAKDALRHADR